MTYEKFEHKVLGMLLEGNDPRFEKLIAQTWELEVLSRNETDSGFNVNFLAPSPLAIKEPDGKISGVVVKLSGSEIINLELVIKNGLINSLEGNFIVEMNYAELIKSFNALTFSYKNEKASEPNFPSDNRDPNEVTFVKNISTISKELEASITKIPEIEVKDDDTNNDAELIEEPFTLASDVDAEFEAQEQVVDNDSIEEEPLDLITDVETTEEASDAEEIEADFEADIQIKAEIERPLLTIEEILNSDPNDEPAMVSPHDMLLGKIIGDPRLEQISEDVQPLEDVEVLEEAEPLKNLEEAKAQEAEIVYGKDELVEAPNYSVLKVLEEAEVVDTPEALVEELDVAENTTEFSSQREDILLPPSYSIPKVPEAIRDRWSSEEMLAVEKRKKEESLKQELLQEEENLKQEILAQILNQEGINKNKVIIKHDIEESDNLFDGKAPQGPTSFAERPSLHKKFFEEKVPTDYTTDYEKYEDYEDYEDYEFEDTFNNQKVTDFRNLTSEEVSNPHLGIKKAIIINHQELESAALSMANEDEVNRSIELMEQRAREVKVGTFLIALGAVVLLVLLFSLFS